MYSGPLGIFNGGWLAIVPDRNLGSATCANTAGRSDGGFSGTLLRSARIAFVCANHMTGWSASGFFPTVQTKPSGVGSVSWTAISGKYVLNGHSGSPLSFYEATLSAGFYLICCNGPWATTAFFSLPG